MLFRRYFGVNTIWYLHTHFICAKLFAIRNIPSVFWWLEHSLFFLLGDGSPYQYGSAEKSQSHCLNDQTAAKEKELTKITRYKQSLYQHWKDGEISQQEYRNIKTDYGRQAAELADVLAQLNAERAELANGVDKEHPALVAFAKYQSIETLIREILTDLGALRRGCPLVASRHTSALARVQKPSP